MNINQDKSCVLSKIISFKLCITFIVCDENPFEYDFEPTLENIQKHIREKPYILK